MFVNRRRLWALKASHIPLVTLSFLFFFFFFFFSFVLHFCFFLPSSLSVLLQSKKFILTDHSHAQRILFVFFRFSVLSVLSFLFFSHRSLTHRPTPTQAERSLASIFDHTPKSSTTRPFSSSLLSYSFFDLVEASKSASITTIWLERRIGIHSNNLI